MSRQTELVLMLVTPEEKRKIMEARVVESSFVHSLDNPWRIGDIIVKDYNIDVFEHISFLRTKWAYSYEALIGAGYGKFIIKAEA